MIITEWQPLQQRLDVYSRNSWKLANKEILLRKDRATKSNSIIVTIQLMLKNKNNN